MDAVTEDDMGNISKWKESLLERTASRWNINLEQLVYGTAGSKSSDNMKDAVEEESDEEFFKPKGEGKKVHLYILSQFSIFWTAHK